MEKGTRQAAYASVDSAGSRDDAQQGSQRTDRQPAEDHHQQARSDENHRFPAEEPQVSEERNDVRATPHIGSSPLLTSYLMYQILCNICNIHSYPIKIRNS